MTEKIGPVKNPLTVIAIFAGVAEAASTAVMPFVEAGIQSVYVWFVMLFPILLVAAFFLTLNFNPKVLYAPSDYEDEKNFIDMLSTPSASERTQKLKDEIGEERHSEMSSSTGDETLSTGPEDERQSKVRRRIANNPQVLCLLAGELSLAKIERDTGAEVRREAQISVGGSKFLFDGVISKNGKNQAVEVKYFSNQVSWNRIEKTLNKIREVYKNMSAAAQESFSLRIVVVVEENPEAARAEMSKMYRRKAVNYPFTFEVQVYGLRDLEDELGLLE